MSDRVGYTDGVLSIVWAWRRRLFLWEISLVENLTLLLNRNFFGTEADDCWV